MAHNEEKDLLTKAKEHIQALEAEIQRLTAPPLAFTTVLKVLDKERVLVASSNGPVIATVGPPKDAVLPPEVLALFKLKSTKGLQSGDLLVINGMGAIVDKMDLPLAGAEATIKRVFDGEMMEIDAGMGAALVFKGLVAECVKPGDVVQMDRTGNVALRIIPKDTSAHSVETATGVTWADIGGQDSAKAALQEAIEGPIKHHKLYLAYGKKPLKGILLSGSPGNGKTLLAKACANAVREAHGAKEADTAFIYVKGPEVLNMWVGNTEAQIRGLFARAREHKENYGYPAVMFIDEADAILGKRGSSHGSVLASTVVPTFLAEMDGMSDSGCFVLLATNRQDVLDPAIVREGRIDRKVVVARPQMKEAAVILRIHLGKTKTKDNPDELAGLAAAELFSEAYQLYRVGLKGKGVHVFHIRHLVSGAMLAGTVDLATSVAIQRDSATGRASGLVKDDIKAAVEQVVQANRNLNHDDDLMLFAEQHGAEIDGIQRMAA